MSESLENYIGVWQDTNKRKVEKWARDHFPNGTYLIYFYEPSGYHHLYVERPEAFYWAETTDESVCGNCKYFEERTYISGNRIQVCTHPIQRRATSLGKTCEHHSREKS